MRSRIRSTILAVAVLTLSVMPGVANATDLDGNIYSPVGEWPDEHLLKKGGYYAVSDITGVWQAILWADGYLGKCGSSGVDGRFGTGTKNATYSWQGGRGLTADGIVGSNTWGKADNYNVYISGTSSAEYEGVYHEFEFYAPGGGWTWRWDWVGSGWETSGHLGYVSFETC